MEKKVDWDKIPSLEGLEIDWEYGVRNVQDKRTFIRLNQEDMGQLFEVCEINVKVATVEQVHNGILLDISTGGAAVKLSRPLMVGKLLKLGFVLSTFRIVTKGQVRHAQQVENGYKIGVQFIDLDPSAQEFIGGLYASKVFRHAY
ncbi:MAG: PilZ domain-containing protein [Desulfobulbus sp.]|nr:PilZ domain-containing protein [Desulfobulbus sp.]